MADWIKTLDSLNVRYTFSINCHSGIADFVEQGHVCGCRRCREQRGEEWTEETEAQAALDSSKAKERFREWALKFMTKPDKLPVDLTQVEGNEYSIIGALRKAARRAGWTTDEIDEMTRRLTVVGYDALVRVARGYCE